MGYYLSRTRSQAFLIPKNSVVLVASWRSTEIAGKLSRDLRALAMHRACTERQKYGINMDLWKAIYPSFQLLYFLRMFYFCHDSPVFKNGLVEFMINSVRRLQDRFRGEVKGINGGFDIRNEMQLLK